MHFEPTLEVLSSVELGERVVTTPVLADGSMLVRTESAIYRFDSVGRPSEPAGRIRQRHFQVAP